MKRFLAAVLLVAVLAGCQSTPPVFSPLPPPRPLHPPMPPMPGQKLPPPNQRKARKLMVATPSVSLAWDQSQDATVNGYNAYQGIASGVYTNVVTVQPATNTTVTFGPLAAGTTYFFAATSTATNGLESEYSNEVTYSLPNNAPTNLYVTVFLLSSPNVAGPYTNFSSVVLTNPPAPQLYFKLSISTTNGP